MRCSMESFGTRKDDDNSARSYVSDQSFRDRKEASVKPSEVLKARPSQVEENQGQKASQMVFHEQVQIKDLIPEYS